MTSEEDRLRRRRHARRRRVKQLLRWMPRKTNLETYPVIRWFGSTARKRPYLWSFKVAQCTPAFYAGCIISFLPLYGIQLLLAFGAAHFFRANLPITAGLQFVSNPFTIAPLYFMTYRVGNWVIEFTGYGVGVNRVWSKFNALIIGGIIVGTVVGGILDMIYRLAAYEARKHARQPAVGSSPNRQSPEDHLSPSQPHQASKQSSNPSPGSTSDR